jgi:hypothetical protein
MNKLIKTLLVILGLTLIVVALSINTFPQWLSIPGGLLILLGIALNAVLDIGSKIKDWVDLLFVKEENDHASKSHSTSNSPIVKADRGSNAAGRDIHITQNLGQEKSRRGSNPILRIRDYGNEPKNLYGINDFVVGYDTLYIDIFNKQKFGVAEKVWAKIEWINENSVVEVSHRGRWHIASETMKNETVKENLQYRNIDSNQAPQRLYFAWTPKNNIEKYFYGLERDMDGRDSWGYPKYKLEAEEYTAKITLQGNNGVKQQFKYRVRNSNGKILIIEALTNESRKRS